MQSGGGEGGGGEGEIAHGEKVNPVSSTEHSASFVIVLKLPMAAWIADRIAAAVDAGSSTATNRR